MANRIIVDDLQLTLPAAVREWITFKSKECQMSEMELISEVVTEYVEEKLANEDHPDLVHQLIRNLRRF